MDFFKTAQRKGSGYTVIIGCGRLGASLANAISDKDASVMIVDRDERAFRKLGTSYGGLTLTGDATDIAVLRSAEIERADTVVSVTNEDNTNIMVAQIARNVYHIPNVICRLYDPERRLSTRNSASTPSAPRCSPHGRSTACWASRRRPRKHEHAGSAHRRL